MLKLITFSLSSKVNNQCNKYKQQIKENNLFNTIHQHFIDVRAIRFQNEIIMDYFMDSRKAAKASGGYREYQLSNFELLEKIKNVFDENNIEYWIDFGTLLGAVRHEGFIPWDDDIDIACFSSDYLRIKKLLTENFKNLKYKECNDNIIQIYEDDRLLDIFLYKQVEKIGDALRCEHFVNMKNKDYGRAFPDNILKPFGKLKFEGVEFNVPNDVNSYLRVKYGNYLLLPKHPHHHGFKKNVARKIFYPELESDF